MGDLHAPPVHSADHVRSVRTSIDWRRLSRWLLRDREITQQEYERIVERCTVMESRQHPLVRLAQLGVQKASDGTPMDMEYLVRFLAHKAGLEYLKIDPLKVDAGRIAETMSSSYSERHKILPVQVSPTEIVVATSQPFLTDWVPEVERQCRNDVRLVVPNPEDIAR